MPNFVDIRRLYAYNIIVVKFGHSWVIPNDAKKLIDKRIKSGKYIKLSFLD